MGVQITIREVPEAVRDELAARAARQGRSMQEYLRRSLEILASKPSPEQWLEQVQQRKLRSGTIIPRDEIIQARDDDRR